MSPRKRTGPRPAGGSRTSRPMAAALDLCGRRWALRVIWELRAEPITFRELRARCGGPSPTVLNTRLGELRERGLVAPVAGGGYALSGEGKALVRALGPFERWAEAWARSGA